MKIFNLDPKVDMTICIILGVLWLLYVLLSEFSLFYLFISLAFFVRAGYDFMKIRKIK